jgi:hypothetical protein
VSRIHQIYLAYRPAGSSAPGHDGANNPNTGGYALRASSVRAEDPRDWCQRAEPDLDYQLPRDVPVEVRARLAVSKSPQRMVFCPHDDGYDVLALVSHRRETPAKGTGGPPDVAENQPTTGSTESDADSSFAHVLINDPQGKPAWWSNLTCLELWGAPRWARDDSAELPTELESLSDLSEMLGGRPPLVSRDLVVKFLTAPAGADWGNVSAVVPRRWQKMRPEQRCKLFTVTLGGFLAAEGQLLLVAEPSVAALWFYGFLRMLPNIPMFAGMGFSTYEPQVASLRVPLVATCFAHPATTDLAKRLYSAPRFAMNTYRKRCSRAFAGDQLYAPFIVDRLLRYGWPAVERFLVRLQVGGAKTVQDLEAMTSRLAGAQAP